MVIYKRHGADRYFLGSQFTELIFHLVYAKKMVLLTFFLTHPADRIKLKKKIKNADATAHMKLTLGNAGAANHYTADGEYVITHQNFDIIQEGIFMGLLNKILGEAMIYTNSFGLTKEPEYEEALNILLSPKPNPVDLAKAENAVVMANKRTDSEAKRTIGVALCKTYGLLTDAKTHEAQMQEAANYLSSAAVEASAEDDHSSFDVLKRVMESDYAKRIGLPEFTVEHILNVKEWDGTEYVYLACANMYGWGCPVSHQVARKFLEENALPALKDEYHKGIHRLLDMLDEN